MWRVRVNSAISASNRKSAADLNKYLRWPKGKVNKLPSCARKKSGLLGPLSAQLQSNSFIFFIISLQVRDWCVVVVFFFRQEAKQRNRLTDSASHILHYHLLQIMVSYFNEITRTYFFLAMNTLQFVLSVLCNVASVGFHAHLLPVTTLFNCCFSFTSTSYLFVTYFILGSLNSKTRKVLLEWKRSSLQLRLDSAQRKELKSCRPAEVHIGNFEQFQKIGALKIVSKIVTYTVKIIVTSKKLGYA